MLKLLITITMLTLLLGCSSKNAFTTFNLSEEQEKGVSSLLSSKIKSTTGQIDGVLSVVYLNEIYPESYHTNEYFFVYLFVKNQKQRDANINDLKSNLKLNGKSPMKIKELSNKNKFSHLTFIKSNWNEYYIVAFKKQEKSSLSLVLENDQSFSDQLVYQKDK